MTVRKLLIGLPLLLLMAGRSIYAADVLDYVEAERQSSTDIADSLWRLAELGLSLIHI